MHVDGATVIIMAEGEEIGEFNMLTSWTDTTFCDRLATWENASVYERM